MIPFRKKKHDAVISSDNSHHAKRSFTDFIPYYHHYDSRTLETKNGELLQIIKITNNLQGLNYEGNAAGGSVLREVIRHAITESVKTDHFSFWIHTLRKKRRIQFEATHHYPFAAYVHDEWKQKNRWQYQYFNEVYVTVLREGQSSQLLNAKHLKDTLLPKENRMFRNRYLDAMHRDLEQTVQAMLNHIRKQYNAQLLGIIEKIPSEELPEITEPIFFSEPMEFLGTLVNLAEESYPLSECEIAQDINSHALTFGYNAMESKHSGGQRRFAGMLTLKRYHEIAPDTLDRVLQSSTEMIISQFFAYVPAKEAIKDLKPQKELFDISGDYYSAKATGIEDAWTQHSKRAIDFGEEETSILVITDDYKPLEGEVTKVQDMFGALGLNTIREDILFEDVFWASLPGNFCFVRRKDIISSSKVAGFARLNRFPTGHATGNHWNDALSMIPTQVGSPYFFNFHFQDNGHTALFDFNSFHDPMARVLVNFLTCESLKWQGKLYIFDTKESSRLMFDKLSGHYHHINATKPLLINPFTLENSPRNQSFLLAWMNELTDGRLSRREEEREAAKAAIERVFSMPLAADRTMMRFLQETEISSPTLAHALKSSFSLFDGWRFSEDDDAVNADALHAFNFDALSGKPTQKIALFAYILHRIISHLDGRPTIIVIHDAVSFLENPFFAPRIESLMEMLKQHNAMLLMTFDTPEAHRDSHTVKTALAGCATKLYLPDEINMNYDEAGIGLSQDDSGMLRRMNREDGQFLMKQDKETISLQVNLYGLYDLRAIFANDVKNLITAGGPYASLPKN